MPRPALPASMPADVRSAFLRVWDELDKLAGTKNIDFHGRRIINAGDAVAAQDYVTKQQLDTVVAQPGPPGPPGPPGNDGSDAGPVPDVTTITEIDETWYWPSSRRLVEGPAVAFDTSTGGQFEIGVNLLRGDRIDQPAASDVPGGLYFVEDEKVIEQSDGVNWGPYGTAEATANGTILSISGYMRADATGQAAAAGSSAFHSLTVTAIGDAGGTSDFTGVDARGQISGANSVSALYGFRGANVAGHTAGTLTTQVGFEGLNSITGAGTVTNSRVFQARTAHSGAGNVTGSLIYYETSPGAPSSSGDYVGTIFGHLVRDIGRAAATIVTGYDILDLTKGSGDLYGYRSRIAAASGKYGAYFDGTAQNYFRGNVGIGSGKTVPAFALDVNGLVRSVGIAPGEGSITLTGSNNDVAHSNVGLLRCNNASDLTITGFVAGVAGQILVVVSVGAGNVFLAHQNAGSAAANRLINFATSGNTPLAAGVGVAIYQYDDTTDCWRLLAHDQGAFITPTFAAGDFTGNNLMTWTVASGNITADAYYLRGRQLTYVLEVNAATTIGGTPDTTLRRALPYTTAKQSQQPCIVSDPGVGVLGFGKFFVTAAGTLINIRAGAAAPVWGAGATAGCNGVINCEVQ